MGSNLGEGPIGVLAVWFNHARLMCTYQNGVTFIPLLSYLAPSADPGLSTRHTLFRSGLLREAGSRPLGIHYREVGGERGREGEGDHSCCILSHLTHAMHEDDE